VGGAPSPPTERVVNVLNLLARAGDALSASEIARRLNLSTSTSATVLAELDAAGYVERGPDKAYQLGAGLLVLMDALHQRFPLLGAAHEELHALQHDLQCSATFTRLSPTNMQLLAAADQPGQLPAIVRVGEKFPIEPPYGWLWAAWQPTANLERWIDSAPFRMSDLERAHYRSVLRGIRERGYSVASLEPDAALLVENLTPVLAALASDPTASGLRTQLIQLFALFGRHVYATAELTRSGKLPVSYLLGPVFGPDGQPSYEIELAVMRPAMTKGEIVRAGSRLLESTHTLTRLIGGQEPNVRRGRERAAAR